jgi:5-(carboxyamino)imidazole ribonucleotide synthase
MTKTIGILGGGQLARMIAIAAAQLGFRAHIYAPESDNPAYEVTPYKTIASYEDETALKTFAAQVDVITYEFENVPSFTAAFLENLKPLSPSSKALSMTQERGLEKTFIQNCGLPLAPFILVENLKELELAVAKLGRPSILKTRRFGYDGKGQVKILADTDLKEAYGVLKNAPCVLEGFVNFEKEVSVLIARSSKSEIKAYETIENEHRNHILYRSLVPAQISASLNEKALKIAHKLIEKLDYVGVLAIEMFVCGEEILVNELAPRVHNSGHWTIEGAQTSQFTQHIRAIMGLPLGDTKAHGTVEMINLIGNEIYQKHPSHYALHHYGKKEAREGRKMGHLTRVFN